MKFVIGYSEIDFRVTFLRALMSQTQEIIVQKQKRVKENRLDKAAIRFNTSLATNSQLRSMIDHLRKERAVFEGQYRHLQRVSVSIAISYILMWFTRSVIPRYHCMGARSSHNY